MKRAVIVAGLLAALHAPAHARPAAPAMDEQTLHVLARTLVAEATWHENDFGPIAWVLHKRWTIYCRNNEPVPFAEFVKLYSALWKPKHTSRKRTIRKLPWDSAAGEFGGKRWDKVRQWVEKWNAGEVRDPCPAALQWGGTMDKPAGHWAPVSCGRTDNIFYTVNDSKRRS